MPEIKKKINPRVMAQDLMHNSFVDMLTNSYQVIKPVIQKKPKLAIFYLFLSLSVCIINNIIILKLDDIIDDNKKEDTLFSQSQEMILFFLLNCLSNFAASIIQKFISQKLYLEINSHYYTNLIIAANTKDNKSYGAPSIIARSNTNFKDYANLFSEKILHLFSRSLLIIFQLNVLLDINTVPMILFISIIMISHYISTKINLFHNMQEEIVVKLTNQLALGKSHFKEILHLGYQHQYELNILDIIKQNANNMKKNCLIQAVREVLVNNINSYQLKWIILWGMTFCNKELTGNANKADVKLFMLTLSLINFYLLNQVNMDYLSSLAKKIHAFNQEVKNNITKYSKLRTQHHEMSTTVEGQVQFKDCKVKFNMLNIPFSTKDRQAIFIIKGGNGLGKSTLCNLIIGELNDQAVKVATHHAKISQLRMIGSTDILPFDLLEARNNNLMNAMLFPHCESVSLGKILPKRKEITKHWSPYFVKMFDYKLQELNLSFENAQPSEVHDAMQQVRVATIQKIIKEYNPLLSSKLHEENCQLSEGEKRVMQIISAVTAYPSPKILIIDEIFNNIAADNREKIINIIMEYLSTTTLVFTEHSQEITSILPNKENREVTYYGVTEKSNAEVIFGIMTPEMLRSFSEKEKSEQQDKLQMQEMEALIAEKDKSIQELQDQLFLVTSRFAPRLTRQASSGSANGDFANDHGNETRTRIPQNGSSGDVFHSNYAPTPPPLHHTSNNGTPTFPKLPRRGSRNTPTSPGFQK